MEVNALIAALDAEVSDASLEPGLATDLHPCLYAAPQRVHALAQVLRDHATLSFPVLVELTATDFFPREPRFELVYMLLSVERRERLWLKTRLDGTSAHIQTVSDLWPSANWLEREVWDLFGIEFDEHPDPRRILMPEDWEGFPLRKDYPVQIRMKPTASEPMQVSAAEFRANLERDRLTRR